MAILREIGRIKDEMSHLDNMIQIGTFGEQVSATERYRSRAEELRTRLSTLENLLMEFEKPAIADVIKVV
jgi:uncharacterized protein (DUF342 family)